ncbi:PREDICTED: putative Polycomb group protein ASXL2 [Ficedula albicollis]|uniref:putative Polycomb group protein ASXL2 n=1 Tax=Ficedula albicollis TaxID=59894 RepID=UPI0007AD840E|nr:PREDICTED: putative Polycomb group protein ASXL2 [Ficedula albicollis]
MEVLVQFNVNSKCKGVTSSPSALAWQVLEKYPNTPMSHKEILQVIQKEGLKEIRSGTSPLACLNAMLHTNSRGEEGIFYKVPGRMGVYTLKKDIPDGLKELSEGSEESSDGHSDSQSSEHSSSSSDGCATKEGKRSRWKRKVSSRLAPTASPQSGCPSPSIPGKGLSSSQKHSKKALKQALKQQQQKQQQQQQCRAGMAPGMALPSGQHVLLKAKASTASKPGWEGKQADGHSSSPPNSTSSSSPSVKLENSLPGLAKKPFPRSDRLHARQLKRARCADIDVETPDSILVNTNLRALINKHTFSLLPPECQQRLLLLLPDVDRQVGADGLMKLSSSALNNEFFTSAAQGWKERLSEGEFTPEMQLRIRQELEKEKKVELWKEHFFESYYGQSSGLSPEEGFSPAQQLCQTDPRQSASEPRLSALLQIPVSRISPMPFPAGQLSPRPRCPLSLGPAARTGARTLADIKARAQQAKAQRAALLQGKSVPLEQILPRALSKAELRAVPGAAQEEQGAAGDGAAPLPPQQLGRILCQSRPAPPIARTALPPGKEPGAEQQQRPQCHEALSKSTQEQILQTLIKRVQRQNVLPVLQPSQLDLPHSGFPTESSSTSQRFVLGFTVAAPAVGNGTGASSGDRAGTAPPAPARGAPGAGNGAGCGTVTPGAPTVTPGTAMVTSGTSTGPPGTPTVTPGTSMVTPETATVTPGTPTVTPGTPTVTPGASTVTPGTATVTPGAPTVTPGTGAAAAGSGCDLSKSPSPCPPGCSLPPSGPAAPGAVGVPVPASSSSSGAASLRSPPGGAVPRASSSIPANNPLVTQLLQGKSVPLEQILPRALSKAELRAVPGAAQEEQGAAGDGAAPLPPQQLGRILCQSRPAPPIARTALPPGKEPGAEQQQRPQCHEALSKSTQEQILQTLIKRVQRQNVLPVLQPSQLDLPHSGFPTESSSTSQRFVLGFTGRRTCRPAMSGHYLLNVSTYGRGSESLRRGFSLGLSSPAEGARAEPGRCGDTGGSSEGDTDEESCGDERERGVAEELRAGQGEQEQEQEQGSHGPAEPGSLRGKKVLDGSTLARDLLQAAQEQMAQAMRGKGQGSAEPPAPPSPSPAQPPLLPAPRPPKLLGPSYSGTINVSTSPGVGQASLVGESSSMGNVMSFSVTVTTIPAGQAGGSGHGQSLAVPAFAEDGAGEEPPAKCYCRLKAMIMCQGCGAFCHDDCIGPSKLCVSCLVVR